MSQSLAVIKHIALDMDGTIYLGDRLFSDTLPFLTTLAELGIGFDFVTNNNSRGRRDYVDRLNRLGICVSADQIFISTDAAVQKMRGAFPKVRRLFVLGTEGLAEDLVEAGFEIITEGEPDAVLVGFDTTLCYERLCQAAYWIAQGKPYIATHPDRICPTDEATVLPDCGAVCALLRTATERDPDFVPGKPDPAMLHTLMEKRGFHPQQVAMVGDRLYTDIRMALDADVLAILTLTGETTAEEASNVSPGPDIIIENLGELASLLTSAQT